MCGGGTFLIKDIFQNFKETCIETWNLNPTHFYFAPGLVWVAALKVAEVELELLAVMDMLLMNESRIRAGI